MGFYKTEDLGSNIYSFFEMTGVGAYLIVGDTNSLLIDTGYGFGNLRKEVKKISDKPLIVINTHIHADHCLGNSQFEQVYVNKPDLPLLQGDYIKKQYDTLLDYGLKKAPALRLILIYAKLKRKPFFTTKIEPLPDSMEFDLGGRMVRFVCLPGHTPGSIVVLDEMSETVFAGDCVNPGTFLFFDPGLKLREYANHLDDLAGKKEYRWLRVSHEKEALPFDFVRWYADFLRRVDFVKSEATDFPNGGRTVYQYTEKNTQYGECSVFFDVDCL